MTEIDNDFIQIGDWENIFNSSPCLKKHKNNSFAGSSAGGRLGHKDNFLYLSIGDFYFDGVNEKDITSMNGSDYGKIIEISLDNLKTRNFAIGLRNPQGMSLSAFDGNIYITNHGAKGGDWFGVVKKSENYGWKILGWGGTNYTGTKIGPKWKPGFTKAIKYWVPSIAVSSMVIYKGKEFQEWNGDALITSLKDQSLRKIKFKDINLIKEDIIFKNIIGRIRDIEIQNKTGEIFLLTDQGSLWRLYK